MIDGLEPKNRNLLESCIISIEEDRNRNRDKSQGTVWWFKSCQTKKSSNRSYRLLSRIFCSSAYVHNRRGSQRENKESAGERTKDKERAVTDQNDDTNDRFITLWRSLFCSRPLAVILLS